MDIPIDKPLSLLRGSMPKMDRQVGTQSMISRKKNWQHVIQVGWLMVRNNEKVIIMADYSEFEDDKEGGRHIAIPNGWVNVVGNIFKGEKQL